MIRLLIVDDQQLVRAGLRALLENSDDIEIVGEAANGREAMAHGRATRPDLFLMDLKMPVMDGIAATAAIRADPLLRDTPVLVLTTFDDRDDVLDAVRAGATGYLLKDMDADALRSAVRAAVAGESPVSPPVARQMMAELARMPSRRARAQETAGLTDREREILAHVGRGLSNEEIGRALFLSPDTARTYVSRLLTKLSARDRAQLVVLAHRAGLVD
ncbi:response regulator transcription factor [Micromonospora sp. WMMD1102]|uniref:response regulator n=1 Tax=Micromonospora sp. WMMD1102 TaxID=3016105 RepID=UPI0024156138|nr:response regulator transcription factor [Micromonospora sp. WMMD1102]MDG4787872.1 response regulator transcription factor [Micromonospora sp. WMMD1102]